MVKIHFENGDLKTEGYVIVDNIKYTIVEAEYEGETPLSAENLNQMQTNIENELEKKANIAQKYNVTLSNDLADNGYITVPANYKVGDNSLQVYFEGCLLEKNVHYIEVGQTNALSNQIRINSWGETIDAGFIFTFIVQKNFEGGTS